MCGRRVFTAIDGVPYQKLVRANGARVEIREGLRENLRAEASYAERWRSIVGFWVARTVARLGWPGLDGMVVACVGC